MSDRFDHTLERKLERNADEAGGDVVSVHRFEVINGTGRRRRWSTDEKARILVESFAPGANVSEVARRNGLTPQQLFGWRRKIRSFDERAPVDVPAAGSRTRSKQSKSGEMEINSSAAMAFAPIVVAAVQPPPPPTGASASGTIEIVIGDCVVRVVGQVETAMIVPVLRAVRRSS